MLHFPSSLHNGAGSASTPRRTDSLNATQTKASGSQQHQIFLAVEQELHDARRVSSHGQEDDLRSALNMVINRVTELSKLLSDAFKSKAELELQLNVAKSNLQLVIANNEMLEEALKSSAGSGRDVGWRRASRDSSNASASSTVSHEATSPVAGSSPTEGSAGSNSRFFKTFFNSRPGTPTTATSSASHQHPAGHLTSPSMPSLSTTHEVDDALQSALHAAKAAEEKARQEAEKARQEAAAALKDKAALEAEVESLSQALFEEANRMVASERKRRAEVEGELKKLQPMAEELKRTRGELREARGVKEALEEALEEKAALRSALRLIEGENVELRSASRLSMSGSVTSLGDGSPEGSPERVKRHRRTSSEIATKSPTHSPAVSSAEPSPYIPAAPSPQIPHSPYTTASSPQIPQSTSASSFTSTTSSSSSYLSASEADGDEDEDGDVTFAPTPTHSTFARTLADSDS
ncbi:hypothetical protein FB45DRAFT_938319 [Roridomyces roridus]|uniref:GDP/GTP exchange factor Sec2 N-terminal domain-containing protein n=1 Tax=Roridomyces roridus TaxID=1738132 RepID=A0AAD7B8N5_9AGAR|nr:hypothetical protein FB45DRAFT_938319 [Roridomyces roridus]